MYIGNLFTGGIFYEDEVETLRAALEIGAAEFHFTTSVKEVKNRGDFIKISELVCELASVSCVYLPYFTYFN